MLSFKPTFSLSSFTFIKRLFSSSSLSVIRVVSFAYLRLLIILLEKTMAPHSITLPWKIPWTEEPGRLQSVGSLRGWHDWVTSLSLFLSCIGEGSGNPLQCSCLENPRDGGTWWAAIYGVAQSRTWLKRLSSSSSTSSNPDSSLCFLQFSISHDVLCIEVR